MSVIFPFPVESVYCVEYSECCHYDVFRAEMVGITVLRERFLNSDQYGGSQSTDLGV